MANKGIGYALSGIAGLIGGRIQGKRDAREQARLDEAAAAKKMADQASVDKIAAEFSEKGYRQRDGGGFEVDPDFYTPGTPTYQRAQQAAAFKAAQSPKTGGAPPLSADAISRLRAAYAKGEPIPDDLKELAIPSGYANMFSSGKPAAPALTAGQLQDFAAGKLDPNVTIPPAYAQYGMPKQAPARPPEQVQLDQERAGLAREQANKLRNAPPPISEGQKALDRNFATKQYADYYTGGGRAGIEKNLSNLEDAAQKLDSGEAKTGGIGGIIGSLGKPVRDIITPQTAATEDQVKEALQGSLKQVLDSQFAAREAEQVLERIWNPRLPSKENARRVRAEINRINAMAQDREAAAQYFENNGTLQGFVPSRGDRPKGNPSEERAKSAKKLGISTKSLQAIDAQPAAKAKKLPPALEAELKKRGLK